MATTNYTVRVIDRLLRFKTTSGNVVATLLPFKQTPNAPYEVHRMSHGDGNTVTIQVDPSTTDFLLPDGSTSITLDDTTHSVYIKIPDDGSSPAFVTTGGGGGGGGGGGATIVGFTINDATTGVNIGPMLVSPGAGSVTKCVVCVKVADTTVDLTFDIKQNGVSVFSAVPTIPAATGSGMVINPAGTLTATTVAIAADDVFSIDVTSGSANWCFTTQLEP